VLPFLKAHCIDCHGPDEQKSGVRFDHLPAGFAADDAVLWTKTYRALESGRMPPESEKRPESGHAQAVNAWIFDQSQAARSALGSGSQRRLNRREYAALVTNVLKLNVPQFEKYLPGDRLSGGFDTVAAGLQDATAAVNVVQEVVSMLLRRVDFLEPKADPPEGLFGDFISGKREAVGRLAKKEHIKFWGGGLVEPHFVNDSLRQGNVRRHRFRWRLPADSTSGRVAGAAGGRGTDVAIQRRPADRNHRRRGPSADGRVPAFAAGLSAADGSQLEGPASPL
jgi:hypothetical protein